MEEGERHYSLNFQRLLLRGADPKKKHNVRFLMWPSLNSMNWLNYPMNTMQQQQTNFNVSWAPPAWKRYELLKIINFNESWNISSLQSGCRLSCRWKFPSVIRCNVSTCSEAAMEVGTRVFKRYTHCVRLANKPNFEECCRGLDAHE